MSERTSPPPPTGRRILIAGHGQAGQSLAADIRAAGDVVVGFVDDVVAAPEVLGTLEQANDLVREHEVDVVFFAIPSASGPTVRAFFERLDDGVQVAIIPRTYRILSKETVGIQDLTDVDVLQLIGRAPVKQEVHEAQRHYGGRRVLVTGAAGSIGSEIVRQLVQLGAEVVGIDISEAGVFFLGQELAGHDNVRLRICDVRQPEALARVFEELTPDVVFHAAAYKHVPLMQQNPIEAINNNVGGTLNVLRQASAHCISEFVLVSTDKAVHPANVMGASKRLCELMMVAFQQRSTGTRFNAVRFGNVMESSGSVLQIFRNLIAARKSVTVTHPQATRYFMTIDEASQLVIHSALVGEPGDIFVLDMGEPVRILELAESILRRVAPDLSIEITGLRPGEKLHEQLSTRPELSSPTANPKIMVVNDPIDAGTGLLDLVDDLLRETRAYSMGNDEAIKRLRDFGFDLR